MSNKGNWVLRCACATALGIGVANAQTASTGLEEIVVTAQKRSENLQDVPVAVSVFTDEMRDKIGAISVQDLSALTPGMQYSAGLDRVSIRGVGRLITNLAIESGVATYLDGVYTGSAVEAGQSPLLIDRIEVLRGPQGTLYGRNSIGGAMNIISKRPTSEFTGEARATVGNYARTVFEGAISGPFTDTLSYRLAAIKTNQGAGYFTNVSGGADEGGVANDSYFEIQVQKSFGSSVDAWFKFARADGTDRNRNDNFLGPYETIQTPSTYTVPSPFWGLVQPYHTQRGTMTANPGIYDNRLFNTDWERQSKLRDSQNSTLEVVWHLSDFDMKYVGGYRSYFLSTSVDYDGSPVTSYLYPSAVSSINPTGLSFMLYPSYVTNTYTNNHWSSHEINISSTGDGPLQWIAGAYAYEEGNNQNLHIPGPFQPEYERYLLYSAPFNPANMTTSPIGNPSRDIYAVQADVDTHSRAVFAQADYEFVPQWKGTLGIRYTKDRKSAEERTRQSCFAYASWCPVGPAGNNYAIDWTSSVTNAAAFTFPLEDGVVDNAYLNPQTAYWTRHLDRKWSATSGTAGIQWEPDSDLMVYGKYSRGYKAGGFNAQSIQQFPTVQPEHVDAFEIGTKWTFGGNFQANVAAYRYNYTDIQTLVFIAPPSGGPGQNLLFNIDKATSTGVELETTWRPVPEFTLLFNYAYQDPIIKSPCITSGANVGRNCFSDTNDLNADDPQANKALPSQAPAALTPAGWNQSVKGQRLPYSPKNKFGVNGNYTFDFTDGELVASATYSWKDKTYYSIFNRSYNLAPSYGQLDLRLTWTAADQRYSLVGYVRNALDKDGYDGVSASRQSLTYTQQYINPSATLGNLAHSVALTPPRTYGAQLQYRFGKK